MAIAGWPTRTLISTERPDCRKLPATASRYAPASAKAGSILPVYNSHQHKLCPCLGRDRAGERYDSHGLGAAIERDQQYGEHAQPHVEAAQLETQPTEGMLRVPTKLPYAHKGLAVERTSAHDGASQN